MCVSAFWGIFFFAIEALACSPHSCKTLFGTICIISAIQIHRINIKGIVVVEPGQLSVIGVWLKSRVR